MTDEELIALLGQHGAEIRRHFDVVAEALRGDVRLVAEGHDVLRRQLEDLRRHVDAVTGTLSADVRLVAEGQSMLRRRVEDLHRQLEESRRDNDAAHAEIIRTVGDAHADLDRRVRRLESGAE
jgi:hypothetical protein